MSRAFVREDEQGGQELPDRVISPHPNFVTPSGLALLESQVRSLRAAHSVAREAGDRDALARIDRDLRYYAVRRATARVVAVEAQPDVVRFGVGIVLRLGDGTARSLRLVGEDEADPAAGLISFVSPLAQTLLGLSPGDTLLFGGSTAAIESLSGR
jgi:transcription elongation GreA/GreB family factor